MARLIEVREAKSDLRAQFALLDELAPANAQALWMLCEPGSSYEAMHAIWTGPEISCPVDVGTRLTAIDVAGLPLENATSFPAAGDLALVAIPRGRWKDVARADIIDLGFFYGDGARLLLPMGWIFASVCARIVPQDMSAYQAACRRIRRNGACQLSFSRTESP